MVSFMLMVHKNRRYLPASITVVLLVCAGIAVHNAIEAGSAEALNMRQAQRELIANSPERITPIHLITQDPSDGRFILTYERPNGSLGVIRSTWWGELEQGKSPSNFHDIPLKATDNQSEIVWAGGVNLWEPRYAREIHLNREDLRLAGIRLNSPNR